MQLYARSLCSLVFIVIALHSYGQINPGSLYKDFDLASLKPFDPAVPQNLNTKGFYIRNLSPKKKAKETIELIKVYRDSGSSGSRKAAVLQFDYGTVVVFKMMKEPGYEKVIIFADWDYHYDSLLIKKDTLYFKGISDGMIELSTVYPEKNDTIKITYGYRNTRYDFLKKFSYKPALKNYYNWFPDDALDYIENYTLVKRDNFYELIKVETNRDRIGEYDYKRIKEKYAGAGLSPFWLALTELSY